MHLPDELLDRLIAEDVPYFDLTTHLLGIGGQAAVIRYFTREATVVCGTEEVGRMLEKLGGRVTAALPDGTAAEPGAVLLEGVGPAEVLHTVWKAGQNLLDGCCAVAAKTRRMVELVHAENPNVLVVTTRKSFPGTKALTLKAVLAGGALPHRLGLSESILIFKQHMNFLGGLDGLLERVPELRRHACEKKLIVEAEGIDDGLRLCRAGVDGLQLDKLTPEALAEGVPLLRAVNPTAVLLAAGGINEANAAAYARTGVDALVTTSLFTAKPVDIGVRLEPV